MRGLSRLIMMTTSAALGIALATGDAAAQGPVRSGLQRTGEGARRVVQGTGEVVRGTGRAAIDAAQGAEEITRGAARGAADVAGDVLRGTARGLRTGVAALTPNVPIEARADANLQVDRGRDARWRFQRHNGEWWYYSPRNSWMYYRGGAWNTFSEDSFEPNASYADGGQPFQGEYSSGYRGVDGAELEGADASQGSSSTYGDGPEDRGPAYALHYDQCGREFICVNGRRVYFYEEAARGDQRWEEDSQGTPTPAIPANPRAGASSDDAADDRPTPPADDASDSTRDPGAAAAIDAGDHASGADAGGDDPGAGVEEGGDVGAQEHLPDVPTAPGDGSN